MSRILRIALAAVPVPAVAAFLFRVGIAHIATFGGTFLGVVPVVAVAGRSCIGDALFHSGLVAFLIVVAAAILALRGRYFSLVFSLLGHDSFFCLEIIMGAQVLLPALMKG